jgi:hypothetical protein
MGQTLSGEITKQSAADLLGWNSTADVPLANTARIFYNSTTNTVHIINSAGTELLSGGTPGGSNHQIQYNNATAFGGIDNGTSGWVLTSNGASSAPSFQAAGGGSSVLLSITVTLTAAQLKALHATPVQLAASPGAGKMVLVQGWMVKYTHVATDYTLPLDAQLQVGAAAQVAADYSTWETEASGSG